MERGSGKSGERERSGEREAAERERSGERVSQKIGLSGEREIGRSRSARAPLTGTRAIRILRYV